ncbi:MAG: hypothetical protein D4R73_04935 [Deltaproteobacteria bacterium]|nr:MAG: hypothetical protein D4R73_04935 [Deltaproteobacteria bacterium]
MKQLWQRFRFTALVPALALTLAWTAGCVGMASQAIIAKHLAKPQKFYNAYTRQEYDTMEESLKATRDCLNQDLAKVTPLKDPLKCKALIIIPSESALKDQYEKIHKGFKEQHDMVMRTQIPDYDQWKERSEKRRSNNPQLQQIHAQTDEEIKRIYDHSVHTVEIHYDFLVEALKKRHIFQEVGVQKAREIGNSHASAAPGYGVVIYLVSLTRPAKTIIIQNLWHLKTAGSEEPWLIGSDESVSGWLVNVEKTAREQLKFEKP